MKLLTVKVGEAVQIGDVAFVRVKEKSGQRVTLAIATELAIEHIPTGILPPIFSTGLSGTPRYHRQGPLERA